MRKRATMKLVAIPRAKKATIAKGKKVTENEVKVTPKADTHYESVVKPVILQVSDEMKLVISVKKDNKSEDSTTRIDIRQYITTDFYTGYTKKGINFPIELFDEFRELLEEVNNACEKKGV